MRGFLSEKLIPIFQSGPFGYLPRASYDKGIYQRSWVSLDPLKLHIIKAFKQIHTILIKQIYSNTLARLKHVLAMVLARVVQRWCCGG